MRGGGHRYSEVEIAGSLLCAGAIHRPAPALSSFLRRRSPHPVPALFLRYACVLPHVAPAPSPALCLLSPQQYTGAGPCTATALSSAVHRSFTLGYSGALCRRRRLSLFFSALPRPSLALFPTICRHLGMPRLLDTICDRLLVGEPCGGAGYGARCRNRTIV